MAWLRKEKKIRKGEKIMGVLGRFAEIMKANINDLLDKCEDPAKMVDQKLRDLREDLAEVKKETAGVMAEAERCKSVVTKCQTEVTKWTEYAKKALQAQNEGDAKQFIAKKQEAEAQLAKATSAYKVAQANADKMVQMHNKLVEDIQVLDSRREQIKAKIAVAKTQERMNKISSASNTSASLQAFDDLESRVDKRLNQAMAEAELNKEPEGTAEALAKKYGTASSSSVEDELAQMKASMGLV